MLYDCLPVLQQPPKASVSKRFPLDRSGLQVSALLVAGLYTRVNPPKPALSLKKEGFDHDRSSHLLDQSKTRCTIDNKQAYRVPHLDQSDNRGQYLYRHIDCT